MPAADYAQARARRRQALAQWAALYYGDGSHSNRLAAPFLNKPYRRGSTRPQRAPFPFSRYNNRRTV